ncbi:NADPH-dependent FMN reductase [Hathewaya proteolytica DSM 3090]|uniref:NADPH-dependent FMN reductase n=1 Tax=Hathewaya proteolytica DSM 3090 TaxID=1121331 RepID=A0A1M6M117_9CLOT|nr:NAD(P)H-dependent oxidoreductase [Hathewaya proteolytica]SHJ77171.1 NADPH-dependent FMN reductase [Hathewaya proteolytica DSM 3090]
MNIIVINGTEVRGCTYHIKESFLEVLRGKNEVKEFYLPKDLPHFCCGCKNCFLKGEEFCPHAEYVKPIWNAILEADLLIFASPVYALRTTAQMKTLLDHLCVHWMVHRPEEKMFNKKAVILTNAIGIFNGGAQKDIATSLSWMGISHIKKLGIPLLEGIIWNDLSDKRKNIIINKTKKLAKKYKKICMPHRNIIVKMKFLICKGMHKYAAKNEKNLSVDNQHWVNKGWIKI